ncbi:MAG: cell division protein ZapA [Flavobacteriaceae bacterium]|nr:cell division protein ZapA [Flavobacteriaceae bacterium]
MSKQREFKFVIAGRVYPVFADPDQEKSLRQTVNTINNELVRIESEYFIKDKQDSLAMLALQLMVEDYEELEPANQELSSGQLNKFNRDLNDAIETLINKIDLHLEAH